MTDGDSPSRSDFEQDKPGTPARDRAEARIEGVRRLGGVFVEAVRATRLPMVLTDPALPGDPIVFANQAFLDLSGYSMDEVLGRQPHFMKGAHTDARDAARFAEILACDRDGVVETVQYAKSGRRFVATVLLSAFKDERGNTLHHFLSWADETRPMEAEDAAAALRTAQIALAANEERFRLAIEGSKIALYECDLDLRYTWITNPAEGWQASDIVGHTDDELLDPQYAGPLMQFKRRALAASEPIEEEMLGTPTGTPRWFLMRAEKVRGADGAVTGLRVLALDIDERKRRELNRALLAAVADDLTRLVAPDDIIGAAGARLGEALNLSMCTFADLDERVIEVEVHHAWQRDGLLHFEHQIYPLANYLSADFGRLQQAGETMVVNDTVADPRTDAEAYAALGIRSFLAVPYLRDGRWEATLSAIDSRPRQWRADEIDVVREVVERVFPRIQRARAEEELRRSEVRQIFLLALSDAMRAEATASGKITVAARALGEHLGAARVLFAEYDAEAAYIFPGWMADGARSFPTVLRLADYDGEVLSDLRTGRIVRVDDVGAAIDTPGNAAIAQVGVQALLSVPLFDAGRLVINIGVHQHEPRHWTDEDVTLVEEVAGRLWAEVERARAEAALRGSEADLEAELRQVTLLRDLAARLVTEESLQAIYEEILSAAIEITGSMAGTVQMFDEEAEELVVLATRGFSRETEEYFHRVDAGSRTSCGLALRTGTRSYFDFALDSADVAARLHVQDGVRSAQSTPLMSRSGKPIGMVSTHWGEPGHRLSERELRFVDLLARQAADLIEQRRAEAVLRESGERLQVIVQNAQDYAIFTTDPAGNVTDWHEGAEAVFGYASGEIVGRNCAILFTPEDLAADEPSKERAVAAAEGKAPDVRWHVREDGARVFIDGVSTALHNASGRLTGFLKIGQDVTERHAADERQKLLLAELQHRVRNILSLIRSLVRHTRDGQDDVEGFVDHLVGRIDAMARTQTMLTRSDNAGVDLEELVRDELIAQSGGGAYTIGGPGVVLPPKAAEVLALAIHELATNSVKYGVLGEDGAGLSIGWSMAERGQDRWLELRWREPARPASHAARAGFGTELIEQRVPYELSGEGSLVIADNQLEARIAFPLVAQPSLLEGGPPRGVNA